MFLASFEKVISSLSARFRRAEHTQVIKPVTVEGKACAGNRLLVLHRGKITIRTSQREMDLSPQSIYFLPADKVVDITYGSIPMATIKKDDTRDPGNFLQPVKLGVPPLGSDIFSLIEFDVKVYKALDFFKFIDLPCFEIDNTGSIRELVSSVLEEHHHNKLGKQQLINSHMMAFVIELFRYIIDRKLFLQDLGLKIDALTDFRLLEIFTYMENNLAGDLSNEAVGRHVGLSKDYVGQFFKKITNMNLQGYIKTIRINKAVELVLTTRKKIQVISKEVGIGDFAYFCRIFKNAIGSPAKKIQQRSRKYLTKGGTMGLVG